MVPGVTVMAQSKRSCPISRFHHGQRHAKGNACEEQKPKIKTKGAEREVQGDATVTQKEK